MRTMPPIHQLLARALTVLVLLWSPLAAPAAALSGCCLEEQACCVVGTQHPCGNCAVGVTGAAGAHPLPDGGRAARPAIAPPARLSMGMADIWRPPPPQHLI